MDALDLVSGRSFNHAPQTNQRLYLGIDVSGSMGGGEVAGVPGLSPRMAAAAMAMAIARREREPNYYMAGFTSSIQDLWDRMRDRGSYVMSPLNITASDSISDAIQKTQSLPFGRTDCALPMLHAMEMKMNVDCFIILTDSET
jgi:60 kDa SS-A/Ro ribonucleoprotein